MSRREKEFALNVASVESSGTVNETPEEKKETVIYTGESLPNGMLSQYTIFNNGLPEFLKEDIEKCPAIKQLMVPISALTETQAKMLQQGSREHTLNTQILQYVGSGQ